MITAEELEKKILDTVLAKETGGKQRVDMLRACKLYLSTSPSIDFIEKEYERISANIKRRDDLFTSKHKKSSTLPSFYAKLKSDHDREYGTDKLRLQLETLAIILQKEISVP